MEIRKATKRDFNEIFKIIKKEYGKKPYYEKWTKQNALRTLDYYSNWGEIYVAEENKAVIGFMVIHKEFYNNGPDLHVKELAVKSVFQGKGIGKALMQKAEEYARKIKASQIYLSTSLDAPAFQFYKKIGYVPSKRTVFLGKKLK